MITCILNDTELTFNVPHGTPLIEVIRKNQLKGTKLACGEGECGACTVLIGTPTSDGMRYHSETSCISPVINVQGKHVVTIEGLRTSSPGIVQQAMVQCHGTQCGFCTPGFIVSMTGALMHGTDVTTEEIVTAIDGNICRCTGYKSIERAAAHVAMLCHREDDIDEFIEKRIIPAYFKSIPARLSKIHAPITDAETSEVNVGGGTDLFVQKPHQIRHASLKTMKRDESLRGISVVNNTVSIGAGETMRTIQHSPLLAKVIPGIKDFLAPIGSTQIRNMATIGGNLVNASPIGDLTIMFLGLDADLILSEGNTEHKVKLQEFYLGYKTLNKGENAVVTRVEFQIPAPKSFHFERVCKRTYLDVASVNSACTLECDAGNVIQTVHLSAGGVAPIPCYLSHTCEALRGKRISKSLILNASQVLQEEVSPISDIRGDAKYKRLLLRQLFFIHMSKLSPTPLPMQELLKR